jgi:hypothetical protein
MHQMRISTNQISSVALRPKKLEIQKEIENCKRTEKKNKYCVMKLSQIRRRMHKPIIYWKAVGFFFHSYLTSCS